MDAIFNDGATVEAPVAQEAATAEKAVRKAKLEKMKNSLIETVHTTPDFASKLRRLSNSIRVVNTLGYGKSGNIVVDKAKSKDGNRVLKQTSVICGYKLENIGTEPIEYTTEEFAQDETGKYVGTTVTKTWNPGETIDLTRKFTTMLCCIPEISFTLANGKIVASSKKNSKGGLAEELASYYFSFNKAEDGSQIQVNDDEVKLSVDDAEGHVKPEYVKTFGYLNNPKEGKKKRTSSDTTFTTQDLAANYIHSLLENKGM